MSSPFRAALAVVVALSTASHARAVPLLGCTFGANGQDALLYDLDPLTAAASAPRSVGLPYLVGIAFSTSSGLYGLTNSAPSAHPASLFKIDPDTGLSQLVGPTGLASVIEGDIAFDRSTGQLYGLYSRVSNQRRMFTLDLTSGQATLLPEALSGDPSAMAFDSAGQLYVLDTGLQRLLTIDKSSGATISAISLSHALGSTAGMACDPISGQLYVADGDSGGTNRLHTLARDTGELTLIADTGLPQGLAGLTFIPEPCTALMVVLAGLLGFRNRRSF